MVDDLDKDYEHWNEDDFVGGGDRLADIETELREVKKRVDPARAALEATRKTVIGNRKLLWLIAAMVLVGHSDKIAAEIRDLLRGVLNMSLMALGLLTSLVGGR
jgi:hypothetical protein